MWRFRHSDLRRLFYLQQRSIFARICELKRIIATRIRLPVCWYEGCARKADVIQLGDAARARLLVVEMVAALGWGSVVALDDGWNELAAQRHAHAQIAFDNCGPGGADGGRRLWSGSFAAGVEGAACTIAGHQLERLLCGWWRRLRPLESEDVLQRWAIRDRRCHQWRQGLVRHGRRRLRSPD
jgi:hypothetical protein